MPSTIPAIWWGLALLALVAVALVPIGDYLSRRTPRPIPGAPHEHLQRKRAPGPHSPPGRDCRG
ncbi:hypothetical protein [Achromobacter denitrificans]|uniref:Uncharacterized protein n=1 Tax=Achromobacter denitrificans TaxID=32002 RepID=A0A6N0JV18_ACHDE|nr:hypothetical protein [Achromobacter denitrificans]QKQ51093.1 hypothetical protein FOC81_31995 [Achromobacter denitrificans]